MRIAVLAVAALLVAAPALAQTAPAIHNGDAVKDANAVRLGYVDHVNKDGSVTLIVGSDFKTLPANTVSVADGVVKTTLTRKEANKLN